MIGRAFVTFAGLIAAWQVLVWATALPIYMLPSPVQTAAALVGRYDIILWHGGVTALEIVLGLTFGTIIGGASALLLLSFRPARRWLLPMLLVSQAIPVFAIAPLLVLWLGYGLASKVAMATLVIFFPVAATFYDGLRRTHPGWLDLARTMQASPWATLRHIRLPAALPALASGLRVAAGVAPIGAVIGEWVGSSAGLGYLMLQANARLQTDLMFAALFVLALIGVGLYFAVDAGLRRLLPWLPDTLPATDME
ncbi:MAG: ABC transporter permease [Rhodospirillaceae bacterium]|nr:ABC transporter permease [Rhodospirillaceae bacterium]